MPTSIMPEHEKQYLTMTSRAKAIEKRIFQSNILNKHTELYRYNYIEAREQ